MDTRALTAKEKHCYSEYTNGETSVINIISFKIS